MTIHQIIKHYTELAEENERIGNRSFSRRNQIHHWKQASEQRQIATWLEELQDYKQLVNTLEREMCALTYHAAVCNENTVKEIFRDNLKELTRKYHF